LSWSRFLVGTQEVCHQKLQIATLFLPIPSTAWKTRPASNGNFQGAIHNRSAVARCFAPAPWEEKGSAAAPKPGQKTARVI